ncbi:MAG: hypothetical protein NTV79_10265 [Candidatus Aureabacteria bacterium]|nr:hypothetical protein [Candidatus Auribacterota bacterium]
MKETAFLHLNFPLPRHKAVGRGLGVAGRIFSPIFPSHGTRPWGWTAPPGLVPLGRTMGTLG